MNRTYNIKRVADNKTSSHWIKLQYLGEGMERYDCYEFDIKEKAENFTLSAVIGFFKHNSQFNPDNFILVPNQ